MNGSAGGGGKEAEVKETGDEGENDVLADPVDLPPRALDSAVAELLRETKVETFIPVRSMDIASWQPQDMAYEPIKEELRPSSYPLSCSDY